MCNFKLGKLPIYSQGKQTPYNCYITQKGEVSGLAGVKFNNGLLIRDGIDLVA